MNSLTRGDTIDRRVALVTVFAVAAIFTSVAAQARQGGQLARIGVLSITGPTSSTALPPANWDGFVQGLRESGYVEGRNIVFEQRYANGKPELFDELAADLVRQKVHVIFARGPSAVAAARKASRSIPIVGVDASTDPVAAGFVRSLARPGGNITGVFLDLADISGKHLELLQDAIGKFPRAAVIGDLAVNTAQVEAIRTAAGRVGVRLQVIDVRDRNFDGAFKAATDGRAAALIVPGSPLINAYRTQIVGQAAKRRLPAIYLNREYVDAGGLMSYGPDLPEMFRRCGVYVGRILGGTRPEDLPVERPTKFDFSVNMKTARDLNLKLPESLLLRADHVVE